MIVSLIAAVDKNNAIGRDNDLPWKFKKDLSYFKANTLYYPVIMGRKTFESLGEKPLPKRINIIISKYNKYKLRSDVLAFFDLENCLQNCLLEFKFNKVFIIGGGSIYKQSMEYADEILLTEINKEFENCNKFFPEIDKTKFTKEILFTEKENNISLDFCKYNKIYSL